MSPKLLAARLGLEISVVIGAIICLEPFLREADGIQGFGLLLAFLAVSGKPVITMLELRNLLR